jgi:DNA-binding transcriptional ArsR family regulator
MFRCVAKCKNDTMRGFMSITKALADENRVRTLLALRQGELCVCQITELFQLAPSTMSKHLSVLYQAGLVESRKEGRWIHYCLPGKDASPAVRGALAWVAKAVESDPSVIEDARRLRQILNTDPTELCKGQCPK